MPGATEIAGAVKAPAKVPSMVPNTKTRVNMRLTLTPMAIATSRSWITARRTLPWFVRSSHRYKPSPSTSDTPTSIRS
ncbi:hypothetical protein D9M71_748270 [compost metagenome]